ncbi:MAG: DUF6055 domain-containing protein [Chloroflexota bacterium]
MKMRVGFLFIWLIFCVLTVTAQDSDARIQEYFSQISEDNPIVYFDLFGMDEGDTIYLYAESYDFDTFIGVCDITCEEVYETNDDIDFPDDINSALEYTFEDDGDYSIFIIDCCDEEEEGVFRMLMGLNSPEVLDGKAYPTGDPFAVVYDPTWIDLTEINYDDDEEQVQQFYDTLNKDTDGAVAFYTINDAEEDETIYIYVESFDFNPTVTLCDITCDEIFAFNDNISGRNVNSAIEYTFERDGDYTIQVADCCDGSAGTFRVLIGYNAPEVLDNEVFPNGAEIASEYIPQRIAIETTIDRIASTDCSEIEPVERPELSGDVLTAETENFVIHYTLEGEDETDEDFIEDAMEFVELVLEVQLGELGWYAPPRDCGEGGDERYDFYIMEILDADNILGFAQPQVIVGDNPSSPEEEEWAAYGYMALDNDYDGTPNPTLALQSTIAHEFHHLIQFGFDVNDESFWIYEATASWMETQTSDRQDATDYVTTVFREPNLCIGSLNDRSGLRVYGEWLLIDSIAQDFGGESIITLWEIIAQEEGMDAFYEFLDEIGTTPEDVLRRYAIRNLLFDYELGDEFGRGVDVEETIQDFDDIESDRDGIEQMGVQYIFIRDSDTYTFEIDDDDFALVVVGINPDDDEVDVFDLGTEGTVDTDPYDYAYLIVMNLDQHDNADDCEEEDWEVEISDGSDDREDDPNGETFDVENFDPVS